MKKLAALLLALVMCLSLCACGGGNNDSKTEMKVGFIFLHDENSTYDLNFINAAKAACEQLGVTPVMKTNVPEGQECYDKAAELVDDGCTVDRKSVGRERVC